MAACFRLFAGLVFVFGATAVMSAAENAVPVTDEQVAELVKQLDADDFALREAAVNKLVEIGPAAAKQVAEAAQGESLEASTRAFTVLDKWLSGDQPIQTAAREQLAKLAQGAEENSTTRRAKALLNRQPTPTTQPTGVFGFGGGIMPAMPLRAGVARVELRAMAQVVGGVKGRSISISIADGKKTMKVSEGDFNAEIIEDVKEGIKITATTKDKDGKEQKSEYAAKNLEELKEKQPEGHKIYEKYAGQMNQLKIKMEAGELRAVAPVLGKPAAVPLTQEQLAARQAEVKKKVEELKAQIEKQQAAPKPAE